MDLHWNILNDKRQTILPFIKTEHFDIASIVDIGCMKLSAVTSRYVEKDYIDLYFILQSVSLSDLLENFIKKYPNFDKTLILKSLVYFDDVDFQDWQTYIPERNEHSAAHLYSNSRP